ncbi:hypothetical protein ACOSP7_027757 [Xanthoceras sorbifolium]
MEKYDLLHEVGAGTFGKVWKAVDKSSQEVVAIKKLVRQRFHSREECLSLREIKALRILRHHPNIVSLKRVIRVGTSLYLVFEYMESNLFQVMRSRKYPFSEDEVRKWVFQVFQGLRYMHEKGYFHRDLKPDNLLVSGGLIKIGDMGSAKRINSSSPNASLIMSLWYRPPEVILGSKNYSYQVDLWAMGVIMAELLMLTPLFPGRNVSDQMSMICSILGTPTAESWPQGLVLAQASNYQYPQFPGVDLSMLLPTANDNAISLIKSLCSWDPSKRPTASEALKHPFFHGCYKLSQSLPLPTLHDKAGMIDLDDQIPNKNDEIVDNPIWKSKYGPIGKKIATTTSVDQLQPNAFGDF